MQKLPDIVTLPLYWKSDNDGVVGVTLTPQETKTVVMEDSFILIDHEEFKAIVNEGKYHNLAPVCLTPESRAKQWEISLQIKSIAETLAGIPQNAGMDIISNIETVEDMMRTMTTLLNEYRACMNITIHDVPADFIPYDMALNDIMAS